LSAASYLIITDTPQIQTPLNRDKSLSGDEARWFFDFAEVGTLVRVI